MTLYEKFSRLICLRSAKFFGDLILEMRAKKKTLEALGSLFEWKKCCTAIVAIWPMVLHVEVKKTPLKLPAPGKLFFFKAKTATLISTSEGIQMREELLEFDTLGLLTWKNRGLG